MTRPDLLARLAAFNAGMALLEIKGGRGSGNWGHAGRPGKRGGSSSHGGAMSRPGAMVPALGRDDTIYTRYEGDPPWTLSKADYEARYKFTQEIWDDIRANAKYMSPNNPELLVTISPSTKKENVTRLNYYSSQGIEHHEEFKNGPDLDRAIRELIPRNSFTAVFKTDVPVSAVSDLGLHRVSPTAAGKVRAVTGDAKQVAKAIKLITDSGGKIVKQRVNRDKTSRGAGVSRWTQDGRQAIVPDHKLLIQWALADGKTVPGHVLADYPDLKAMEIKGGAGSGNWGHAGRPGKRGGSSSRGGRAQSRPGAMSPGGVAAEYPTLHGFMAGNIAGEVERRAKQMLDKDQTLSPNLAKETAAALIYADYIDERERLDTYVGGKFDPGKQAHYDLYDELEFNPGTIQNALIDASGSRTLIADAIAIQERKRSK